MGILALVLLLGSTTTVPARFPVSPVVPRPLVGAERVHEVRPGDTLRSIAARQGVDQRFLARANGVAPGAALETGVELEVQALHVGPTRRDHGIVVNLPQRMLYLFRDGVLERAWPVAVGQRAWKTPTGRFLVRTLEED